MCLEQMRDNNDKVYERHDVTFCFDTSDELRAFIDNVRRLVPNAPTPIPEDIFITWGRDEC